MGCCRSNFISAEEVIVLTVATDNNPRESSYKESDQFDDMSINSYSDRKVAELNSRRFQRSSANSASTSVSKSPDFTSKSRIETAFIRHSSNLFFGAEERRHQELRAA